MVRVAYFFLQILVFHVVSWGLPLAICAIFLIIFEMSALSNQKNLVWRQFNLYVLLLCNFFRITRLLGDFSKTVLYACLEVLLFGIRIRVFFVTREMFSEVIFEDNSANAQRAKAAQSQLVKQALLYFVPFAVCVTFLLVGRVVYIVDLIVRLQQRGWDAPLTFTVVELVGIEINRMLFPCRGMLDALIYSLWSKNFTSTIYQHCCSFFRFFLRNKRAVTNHDVGEADSS